MTMNQEDTYGSAGTFVEEPCLTSETHRCWVCATCERLSLHIDGRGSISRSETKEDLESRVHELERRAKLGGFGCLPCSRCGGPHQYDVSVPSAQWNAVVRPNAERTGEFLCLSCILLLFAESGATSFTAELYSGETCSKVQRGTPVEFRFNSVVARDAQLVTEENNLLRVALGNLLEAHRLKATEEGFKGVVQRAQEAMARAYRGVEVQHDWYFTFGAGQPNSGCYTVISGTREQSRREMFRRYGSKWSMQYGSSEEAGVVQWGLRRLT